MRWVGLARVVVVVMLLSAPVAQAAITEPESTLDGLQGDTGGRLIEFAGSLMDQPDLEALGVGTAGSWFPQFDPAGEVPEAATGDNVRDALPAWVTAFNHTTGPADPGCTELDALPRGCLPTYAFRTFSQDGPAHSAGGIDGWSVLRLPTGECGPSGAIVDPHTHPGEPNTNNTVNRIQLQDGAPETFYVSVLTDNTDGAHDPGKLEIRGNAGPFDVPDGRSQVDAPGESIDSMSLRFNGVPDLYVFRVHGFASGDYLKLRLAGARSAASFGGLLFDVALDLSAPHGRGAAAGLADHKDAGRGTRGAPASVDCSSV